MNNGASGVSRTIDDFLSRFESNYNLFYQNTNDYFLRKDWTGPENSGIGYPLTTVQGAYLRENNSLSVNPLFINSASYDFYLQSNSPCINAGIDRQDYDGDGNTTESINMGAYITGNECIGLLDNCQQQTDTTPPAAPKNLTIL